MTRNYAAPPNRPPKDPQPRDDGMHRTMNMQMAFARMSLGGRTTAWDPHPRDPPNGFIVEGADPNPRDPGNGQRFAIGPQPRDPGTGRQFAMGPQPRDDGTHRTRRLRRGPQPRDPGN